MAGTVFFVSILMPDIVVIILVYYFGLHPLDICSIHVVAFVTRSIVLVTAVKRKRIWFKYCIFRSWGKWDFQTNLQFMLLGGQTNLGNVISFEQLPFQNENFKLLKQDVEEVGFQSFFVFKFFHAKNKYRIWDYFQIVLIKHLQLFQENCWVSWSGLRPWWIGFVSRFAARFSVKDQLDFSQKSSSSLTVQYSLWIYLSAW